MDEKNLYLDLMKRCLAGMIYGDDDYCYWKPEGWWKRKIADMARRRGIKIIKTKVSSGECRAEGRGWPERAHTMIGTKRLDNIQFCVEDVLRNNIPGDLIEAGAHRGGATIFMRAVLKVYDITDRIVYVADSFKGLPRPDAEKYPVDKGDSHYVMEELRASLEEVRENFRRYNLLDNQVKFIKGWFKDTLPDAPMDKIAVMRLDADMYGSTMEALVNLYDKLSVGGYAIADDYLSYENCRKAVDDFRKSRGIEDEMVKIDWSSVYWRKTG